MKAVIALVLVCALTANAKFTPENGLNLASGFFQAYGGNPYFCLTDDMMEQYVEAYDSLKQAFHDSFPDCIFDVLDAGMETLGVTLITYEACNVQGVQMHFEELFFIMIDGGAEKLVEQTAEKYQMEIVQNVEMLKKAIADQDYMTIGQTVGDISRVISYTSNPAMVNTFTARTMDEAKQQINRKYALNELSEVLKEHLSKFEFEPTDAEFKYGSIEELAFEFVAGWIMAYGGSPLYCLDSDRLSAIKQDVENVKDAFENKDMKTALLAAAQTAVDFPAQLEECEAVRVGTDMKTFVEVVKKVGIKQAFNDAINKDPNDMEAALQLLANGINGKNIGAIGESLGLIARVIALVDGGEVEQKFLN